VEWHSDKGKIEVVAFPIKTKYSPNSLSISSLLLFDIDIDIDIEKHLIRAIGGGGDVHPPVAVFAGAPLALLVAAVLGGYALGGHALGGFLLGLHLPVRGLPRCCCRRCSSRA